MVKEGEFVAIFHSIHRVMRAESVLKERKIRMLLIPAPRSLHADCGLAIRYAQEDRHGVEGALEESGLLPEEIYRKAGDAYESVAREGKE